MAPFNLDVKEQQSPHYWYWSKPTPQASFAGPQGNKIPFTTTADTSKGAALTGIGDILASGAKAADAVVDSSAKFEAEQASREERAKRTLELQGAESILAGEQPDQEKINGDLAPLNILKQARANGHLSDTDYWMRVDARLSDIRSRYPVAYRDDIDNTSTKILGENAANATIRSRTADINASLAAMKTQQNKTISRLDKAIDDGAQYGAGSNLSYATDWKKDFLAGKIGEEEVDRRLNAAYGPFFRQKLQDSQIKSLQAEGQITAAGRLSGDAMNQRAEDTSKAYWDHYDQQTGMNASKADSLKLSAQEAQQRAQWVAVQEAQYRQRFQQIITEPRPELGGRTYLDVHGKTGPNGTDAAEERGAQRFKIEAGILTNNDFGAIHQTRKMIDAANTDFAGQMFGVDTLRDYYLKNTWATKELGQEQAKELFKQVAPDMPKMMQDFKNIDTSLRFGAQPGEPPRTIQQSFKDLSKSKLATPSTFESVANTISSVILNPKTSPAAKRVGMDSVYDPTNSGFMGILTSDSQMPMFNKFTDKRIAAEVNTNGEEKQKDDFKNWANTSFRNILVPDLKSLGEYQDTKGVTILWHKPDGDNPPRFEAVFSKSQTDPSTDDVNPFPSIYGAHSSGLNTDRTRNANIKQTVDKINAGLSGLYNVYGTQSDPELAMFGILKISGYAPNENVQGLPAKLRDSMLSIRAEKERVEKTKASLGK